MATTAKIARDRRLEGERVAKRTKLRCRHRNRCWRCGRRRPQRQQRLRCRQRSLVRLATRSPSNLRSLAILAVVAMRAPHARNGIPRCRSRAKPSASVLAVVVIEMFMPLIFSTLL